MLKAKISYYPWQSACDALYVHYFLLPKIFKKSFLILGLRIFNHIDWFTIFNNLIHLQHLKKYKILAKNKIIHSTFQYRITTTKKHLQKNYTTNIYLTFHTFTKYSSTEINNLLTTTLHIKQYIWYTLYYCIIFPIYIFYSLSWHSDDILFEDYYFWMAYYYFHKFIFVCFGFSHLPT